MTVRSVIIDQFEQVARDQGKKLAPLDDGLLLVDTGLDSLCFAIIVARLEDALGCDPFQTADEVAFPASLGSFITLYENAAR